MNIKQFKGMKYQTIPIIKFDYGIILYNSMVIVFPFNLWGYNPVILVHI